MKFDLLGTFMIAEPTSIGDTADGQPIISGYRKRRVIADTVGVGPTGLVGDCRVEADAQGDLNRAVYVWPAQNYSAFAKEFNIHFAGYGGLFAENLLVNGPSIDELTVRIGDIWEWGAVRLRVTQPRFPCYKLVAMLNNLSGELGESFGYRVAKWMMDGRRTGWFMTLDGPHGIAPTHDAQITVVQRSSGPTISEVARQKFAQDPTIPGVDRL